MTSQLKTVMLLGILSGLLIIIGGALGGRIGVIIALGFALFMNVWSYWYSDTIVLRMYNARALSYNEAPEIYEIVRALARKAEIPTPKLFVIPEEAPNAFATGRDPEHGIIAVTNGLLRIVSLEELRGVLAHEIAHIANRDILIQTVAGVIASAIVSIANIMQFTALFGGHDDDESNPFMTFVLALVAPLAAALIQFAISRSREYLADASGAKFSGDPLALAQALQKLHDQNRKIPMRYGNASVSELFIVAPLFGGTIANMFSTHPDIQDRIERLRAMAQ